MPEFDGNLYKCKANLQGDKSVVVCGYYYWNVAHFIDVENPNYKTQLEYPTTEYVVNPYSLCRNTGIKIGDKYLYEYDLVEFSSAMAKPEYGYVEWDYLSRQWSLKTSLNYSGRRDLKGRTIKIIGNIALCENDYIKMQEYSNKQDGEYMGIIPGTECRSTQHINKQIRRFLPR